MLEKLGIVGVVGSLIAVSGLGVIAYESPVVAVGLLLVLLGLGLGVFAVVKNTLSSLGMGAMV